MLPPKKEGKKPGERGAAIYPVTQVCMLHEWRSCACFRSAARTEDGEEGHNAVHLWVLIGQIELLLQVVLGNRAQLIADAVGLAGPACPFGVFPSSGILRGSINTEMREHGIIICLHCISALE
jgi:hypothetical protein